MSGIHASAVIHSTAIVSDGAEIAEGCSVGPYSIIGPHVKLGKGCEVGPHVVIEGRTTCEGRNRFFQFASIGAIPQDLKYRGEPSELIIGERNIIREYVTLQPGTEGGGMKTVIGSGNLFMAGAHVGHDNVVGDGNIIANGSAVAGHVVIGNRVTIGGLCGIHQFVRLGDGSMIAAGAMVSKDVPPFCMVQGDRAMLVGLNTVGLKRAGVVSKELSLLREIYRELFWTRGPLSERVSAARAAGDGGALAAQLIDFCADPTSRGLCALRRSGDQGSGRQEQDGER